MASPISTAYPTPETLIPKCFTISVSNIPSSRIALSAVPAQAGQKHRRLLDLSFFIVSNLKQCDLSHKLRLLRASRFNAQLHSSPSKAFLKTRHQASLKGQTILISKRSSKFILLRIFFTSSISSPSTLPISKSNLWFVVIIVIIASCNSTIFSVSS